MHGLDDHAGEVVIVAVKAAGCTLLATFSLDELGLKITAILAMIALATWIVQKVIRPTVKVIDTAHLAYKSLLNLDARLEARDQRIEDNSRRAAEAFREAQELTDRRLRGVERDLDRVMGHVGLAPNREPRRRDDPPPEAASTSG